MDEVLSERLMDGGSGAQSSRARIQGVQGEGERGLLAKAGHWTSVGQRIRFGGPIGPQNLASFSKGLPPNQEGCDTASRGPHLVERRLPFPANSQIQRRTSGPVPAALCRI